METAKGSTSHDLKEFWHLGRDLPPGHRFETQMPPNVRVEEGDFSETTRTVFKELDGAGAGASWRRSRCTSGRRARSSRTR